MSSILHQEPKKPAPKSPIPRSRSDFNYVGLTTKEKRWTTDFSLLLPAFSRDSSGYSRLTETPVTLQPKPKHQKLNKSPTVDSNNSSDNKVPCRSQIIEHHIPKCSSAGHPLECCKVKHPPPPPPPVPESKRHARQEANIRRSPTVDPALMSLSTTQTSTVICRSPTMDPNILSRSSREANRWPPPTDVSDSTVNRSPLCGGVGSSPTEVVRSQSLRSLRKPSERSPSKIRNSESAQSDVTAAVHKPSTLVETDEYDEEEIRRLRNFSVTPKGLINWGDSFRSQSASSVPGLDHPISHGGSQWDVASIKSYPMASSQSQWNCSSKTPQRYKVAIMGVDEVGKTSLIRQFQTSEYICAFDTSYDVSSDYAITVILNEEESELEFIEYRFVDEESEEKGEKVPESIHGCNIPFADAHVIIYSVTNRRSFLRALDQLSKVQRLFRRSAVLLVGNKSDLVRVRAVTFDEGQASAKERDSFFIETSTAINHQVDELLVSILSQIRAKCKAEHAAAAKWSSSPYTFSKAKGLIKKFLKKACFQSKSCDNLQRFCLGSSSATSCLPASLASVLKTKPNSE